MQKTADISDAILDLENEYLQDVTRLLRLKYDIKTAIDKMGNPVYRLILEERYINLKRWEDIAADNNYSWQWTHKLHKKAVEAIESDAIS